MRQRFFILHILTLVLALTLQQPVFALTESQRKIIDSGAYYLNDEGCLPTNVGFTSTNVNEAEEFVFWTLVSKGLTLEQAAGVLGNMWVESGVNPRRVQGTKKPDGDRDTPPAGSIGYGLVQWT